MQDYNRKKGARRFIYSPLFLLILLAVLLLLGKAVWGVYNKERLSAQYLEQEQAELSRIQARETELEQSVEYLKTDKGVESEIRSKFRVVKEGESVAVIIDDEPKVSPPATTTQPTFWQRFASFFGF